ncbi:regulatory protein RecX [Prosthecochloris sp. ZM]|uniref:regulatory protein RecX n=1 Tax=Prosthecochloris sp. ZM TaxID=2283143 RepID=UPI000DF82161|nr:regulatory protein RecX [Prosthecochloris sp. ZM]RDD31503.1 regulatory protein RecX [Prosthecochloris sp. ZM]
MSDSDTRKALDRAIGYLGIREHSRQEIRGKLKRNGFSDETIEKALERLDTLNLLDDLSFARNFIRSRTRVKPSGLYKLRYELRQKGVPDDIAEEALREYDSAAQCLNAALKKMPFLKGDQEHRRKKLHTHLANRGFDSQTIRQTLDELLTH